MLLLAPAVLVCAHANAAVTRPVSFDSHGVRLTGEIVMPPGTSRAGVILIHGSGPDGGEDYAAQAQMFADSGIAALSYDKRGWSRSGGDWHHRPVSLLADDAIAAAATLRATIGKPVGYWGISQGGWVLAKVGKRDPRAAFLIGVAAAGIDPTGQEMWHRDKLAQAAGFPQWARSTNLHFWKLAFDMMERLVRGEIPLPTSVLEGERASSSFGLDYDPLPDWGGAAAPTLLLYGDHDSLEPWHDSGPRIAAARRAGGKALPVIIVFPDASHTLTTRTTGLAFDWGEAFDPRYAETMSQFIVAAVSGETTPSGPIGTTDPAMNRGGQFASARWFDQLPLQLALLVGLPFLLVAVAIRPPQFNRSRRIAAYSLALAGLALWGALVALLALVIFPIGSLYTPSARFPGVANYIPLITFVALAAIVASMISAIRDRRFGTDLIGAAAVAIFIATWGLFPVV